MVNSATPYRLVRERLEQGLLLRGGSLLLIGDTACDAALFEFATEVQSITAASLLRERLERPFDVVLNQRAAEGVINVAQVFKAIHACTVPGGLMMHESAFSGCVNRGFYTLQPTLFFDVAQANDYQLVALFIEGCDGEAPLRVESREDVFALAEAKQIPPEAHLVAACTKSAVDREFVYPMQGYYQHSLREAVREAWFRLR